MSDPVKDEIVRQVKVQRVHDADMLVIRIPGRLGSMGMDMLRGSIKKALEGSNLEGVPVLILEEGAELEVVKGEQTD